MIRRSVSVPTSRRRRRAAVLAAAALLAGAPLLTACGTPHQGAAAVVGGEQISVSSLQARVNAVREAQAKLEGGEQIIQQSGNLSNATLYGMIFERVIEQALRDAGITVTRAEVQKYRNEEERKQPGGREMFARLLLLQHGIAEDQIDSFCRTEVSVRKLAQHKGANLDTEQGQQQIRALLAETAKKMGVDVNPRYGTWDTDKLTIRPSEDDWLKRSEEQPS